MTQIGKNDKNPNYIDRDLKIFCAERFSKRYLQASSFIYTHMGPIINSWSLRFTYSMLTAVYVFITCQMLVFNLVNLWVQQHITKNANQKIPFMLIKVYSCRENEILRHNFYIFGWFSWLIWNADIYIFKEAFILSLFFFMSVTRY